MVEALQAMRAAFERERGAPPTDAILATPAYDALVRELASRHAMPVEGSAGGDGLALWDMWIMKIDVDATWSVHMWRRGE